MHARTLLAAALSATALFAQVARASDSAPEAPPARAAAPAPVAADKLVAARTMVAARQWAPALAELRRVNDGASADWNNLMGYVLRKGKTPDLAGSEKYYDAALKIDPHHRNTLEYSGELYLMKGDLAKAQLRLATLSSDCAAKCEQYLQLKGAIDSYKAAGNKVVSTDG